jgi:hypothetical protein
MGGRQLGDGDRESANDRARAIPVLAFESGETPGTTVLRRSPGRVAVTGTHTRRAVSLAVVAVALAAVAGGPASGAAGGPAATTGHGGDGNLTWVMLTPQPGLDDGDMENYGVPPRGFRTVDYVSVTWVDGGFAGCGASNAEVFGIDRGNDDPGTEVDQSLFSSIKSTRVNEDEFEADFYDEGDFGGSPPTFNEGDQLVGKTTSCIDTPGAPGWYQVRSTIASKNGNFEGKSHYFWVCDCANEQAAREQLGPPPSESTPTPTASPTPTATVTPTPEPSPTRTPPAEGTSFPSPTPTPTPTPTPEPMPTPTAAAADAATEAGTGTPGGGGAGGAGAGSSGGDAGDGAAAATPTPTDPGNWSAVVERSPTASSGPGFGATAAAAGVLATGMLARRER